MKTSESLSRRRKRATSPKPINRKQARALQVEGLYLLPDGPSFPFENVRAEGKPVDRVVIGASPTANIALTDEEIGDPMISSEHCYVRRTERGWIIHDCNSTNHTLVNDVAVSSCRLYPGSLLTLGQTNLVAYGPGGFNGLISIVAFSVYSLIHRTLRLHGSYGRSARQTGLAKSTFMGWFKKRFSNPPRRKRWLKR